MAYESRRDGRVEGLTHDLKGDMARTIARPGGDRLDTPMRSPPWTVTSSATRAAVT
jgi:hypothetical protein